jgi:hypothetical protein
MISAMSRTSRCRLGLRTGGSAVAAAVRRVALLLLRSGSSRATVSGYLKKFA